MSYTGKTVFQNCISKLSMLDSERQFFGGEDRILLHMASGKGIQGHELTAAPTATE